VPDAEVTIKGLPELQRALRASDKHMETAIRAALPAGGAVVTAAAKHTVPVWTGKLKRSLGNGKVEGTGQSPFLRVGVRPGFGTRSRGASGGKGRATNPKGTWNRGDPVKYGPYVERGTSRMRPRPFLVPALNDNVAKINSEVARAVERVLVRIAKGR
jgi:HK97 gp10 family phage protein